MEALSLMVAEMVNSAENGLRFASLEGFARPEAFPLPRDASDALAALPSSRSGEDFLAAAGPLLALERTRAALPDAAPGKELPFTREPPAALPAATPSHQALKSLCAALSQGGGTADTLRRALDDGSAYAPALIPLWADALGNEQLAPLAVRALTPRGPGLLELLFEGFPQNTKMDFALLDLAAAVHGKAGISFFRSVAEGAPFTSLKGHALRKLAELSENPEDIALFTDALGGDRALRSAALWSLEKTCAPGADEALIREAERVYARLDFPGLTTLVRVLRERAAASVARGAPSSALYGFFTRLLPDLICRPGDFGWLVYECIEAIGSFGREQAAVFLEQMLTLAENQAARGSLS